MREGHDGAGASPARERPRVALRPASADDAEHAFQLRARVVLAVPGAAARWDEASERRHHARRFATQEYRFIEAGGDDVGIMGVARGAGVVRLNQFFVLPTRQGAGIGRAALALLLDEADRGRCVVRLDVDEDNPRARAFYRGAGFLEVAGSARHSAQKVCMERPASDGAQAHRVIG